MSPYYQDDAVTIYHGDFREMQNTCELCIIDPPYNVSLGTKAHANRQKGYGQHYDNLCPQSYQSLIDDAASFRQSSLVTFVTPGNTNQKLWPSPLWTIAWTKSNGVTRTPLTRGQKMNHACWEPVLVYGKLDNPPHSDVINIPIGLQADCEGHPCPKPLSLFTRLISFTECKSVIDPMMGSGTTLRAAKDLGRKAIGIEIEEKYCEIAAKRMAQEVFEFT